MPKWTEYTSKDTLADNDEVMLYDATARANKRGLMSKFWDYVVDKMSTAVISKLETNNKTIIGAINALYSDSYRDILAVSGTDEQSVAISDQYNTPLILALFESDKKVLDMKSIPLNFAIQSRTISVYNPKDLSIYAEVVTDKINNTITLKHYGTGFARIYVR
jgi:hypothetical protein